MLLALCMGWWFHRDSHTQIRHSLQFLMVFFFWLPRHDFSRSDLTRQTSIAFSILTTRICSYICSSCICSCIASNSLVLHSCFISLTTVSAFIAFPTCSCSLTLAVTVIAHTLADPAQCQTHLYFVVALSCLRACPAVVIASSRAIGISYQCLINISTECVKKKGKKKE